MFTQSYSFFTVTSHCRTSPRAYIFPCYTVSSALCVCCINTFRSGLSEHCPKCIPVSCDFRYTCTSV